MKTCPVCALELDDSYLFCPEDGSGLTALDESSTSFVGTQSVHDITSVVLYCPACGAEYPLTFSSCPVHFVPLTKQSIQRQIKPATEAPGVPINAEIITLHGVGSTVATLSLRPTNTDIVEHGENDVESSTTPPSSPGPGIQRRVFSGEAYGAERPGFRIAAIATMIALAIFGLVGLYALVSNLSRRSSPPMRPAEQIETAKEVPFVVIPQAALTDKEDSREERPAASASKKPTDPPPATRVVETGGKATLSSSNGERNRTAPEARSISRIPSQATSVSTAATQPSDTRAPVTSHTVSREFDSRLVRARSSRTSSGYRYDLTFNMQEQLGHSAQWQRVLITTRSASGGSHTQAIPFAHRLGAAGALTFTISVELTGRSEADWRGRINCTTLGWDNTCAPLQATFAANVTP